MNKLFLQNLFILASICLVSSTVQGQTIGVVDVQKVFDGYHKVKDARERLEKSRKIANEEIGIFRQELGSIVKELKETEEKLKNPNIDSSALRTKYQEQVKKAKEKQDDLIQYDKRTKATISQRQRNLLVEHIADIREAVGKVSSVKKLDLVINSSETQLGVFYVKPTFDVTGDVISVLNASSPKK
ncbi:MAG: OmpH family outer membrane protein [Betaproteobacteria bacterium]|jgi:Skp family chaperone for outer membrane proteins|nr:OmpH family outer membrane protein [Betaproteobacteria bacterium]